MDHICLECNKNFTRPSTTRYTYCSIECRGKAFSGKNNPNYGNKLTEEQKLKAREAYKKRGLPWTDTHKKQHSKRMLGPSNKMRGKKHSLATILALSRKAKENWKKGRYPQNYRYRKVSKVEEEFCKLLKKYVPETLVQQSIPNTNYSVDALIPSKKVVVEFQGNYWHANPDIYHKDQVLSFRKEAVTAKEIWAADKKRKKDIEKRGFMVVWVWEKDFVENPESQIKKVIRRLANV